MLRATFLAFLLTSLPGACSGKEGKAIDQTGSGSGSATTSAPDKPSLPANVYEKAMTDLEGYRARMCDCKDVACTDKVFAEFTAWRAELKKTNAGVRPSKEQEQKGNAIDKEMKQCRARVAAGLGTGSGGSAAVSGLNPVDAALAEMEGFKSRMCACGDKACADKVQLEFSTWQRNMRTKLAEKPNTLQEMRGNTLDKEMKECRKKAETATPGALGGTSRIDNMLTEMQTFRDKICACTTKACGTAVEKELEAWQSKAAKDLADAKPTKDQDDKADRLAGEMKTCLGKLK